MPKTQEDNAQFLREAKFHDQWAKSVTVDTIYPIEQFESPSAIEYSRMFNLMGNVKNTSILILGCGLGEEAIYFALHKAKVTAIDISPSMVTTTEKLAKKYRVSNYVKCFTMSATDLKLFKSNSFDFVIGCNLLHHVPIKPTISEVYRVLKKGGSGYFIDPLRYNPIINLYRIIGSKVRTVDETPLGLSEFRLINKRFSTHFKHEEFHLTTQAIFIWYYLVKKINPAKVRYWKRFILDGYRYRNVLKLFLYVDQFLYKYFPFTKLLSWETLISVKK